MSDYAHKDSDEITGNETDEEITLLAIRDVALENRGLQKHIHELEAELAVEKVLKADLTEDVVEFSQRIDKLEAENNCLRKGRVVCKSCHEDTAKAENALCYNCRQRPYAKIEELEAELAKVKDELNRQMEVKYEPCSMEAHKKLEAELAKRGEAWGVDAYFERLTILTAQVSHLRSCLKRIDESASVQSSDFAHRVRMLIAAEIGGK